MKKIFFFSLIFLLLLSFSFPCIRVEAEEVQAQVALIDGVAVDWIDRVVLPTQVRSFYDRLSEGVDGDGEADILIEDAYFNDPDYSIVAVRECFALNGRTLEQAQNEVFDRYEPYMYAVFSAFDRDHPEVFWLTGRWAIGSTARSEGDQCTVEIIVRLGEARDEAYPNERAIKTAIAARDAAIARITRAFDATTTTYEKIVAFNEALIMQNQYNTLKNPHELPNDAHECISALEGRVGKQGPVCEGYAKAFKALCDAERIPCVLVDGIAVNSVGDSEAHMWNYVQLQGEWYAVDVTWNDPLGGRDAAVSGVEGEEFLLVGADTAFANRSFLQSHPVRNIVYPDQVAFLNGPKLSRTAWESSLTVALALPEQGFVYNGSEQRPSVTVKFDGKVLREGRDYTLVYQNAIAAGEATVRITGKGAYAGEIVEHYTIAPKPIELIVTVEDKIYDGTTDVQVSLSIDPKELEERDRASVRVALDTASTASADAAEAVAVQVAARLEGEGGANYRLILPTGLAVKILPKEIRVQADAKTLLPNETEVLLTYTVDSETPIVEGESLSGSLTLGERRKDGSYPILQGSLTDESNPNYRITFVTADVTVSGGANGRPSGNGGAGNSAQDFSDLLEHSSWMLAGIGAGVLVLALVVIVVIVKKKK